MDATQRRSPKYVAALAAAACLILTIGWLARPRDITQSPLPVQSEAELRDLTRRTQRRSLESMTAYFADLATDVRDSLAYIPSSGASGIIWDEARVVTGPISAVGQTGALTVSTASGAGGAEVIASRRLPLTILDVSLGPTPLRVVHRTESLPAAGDWVVAVWQTDQGPSFAPLNFQQSMAIHCGLVTVQALVSSESLGRSMIGGGIFNMDRDLLGVILPCADRVAAIEPSGIDEMLKRAVTVEERVLAGYGILFSTLSEVERRYFKASEGLLVREVWIDTRADAAGIRPGDLLVSLNGQAVASLDDLRPLATPSNTPFELQLRRGSKTESLTLDSSAAPRTHGDRAGPVGLILESPAPTYRIDSVLPESRAARAGVEPGDRLLRINQIEPRSRAQAARAMTTPTATPMMLEIERRGRRIAIVVPEGAVR